MTTCTSWADLQIRLFLTSTIHENNKTTKTSNKWLITQVNNDPGYLLNKQNRIREDLREGWTKDNGVLSFAVLYYIIGKVEEIQAMSVISWKKQTNQDGIK